MAGQLTIDTLKASSGVLATQNGMTGIAKAWVSYNGVAQTISASFNISSVTYNATGNYTINMTTAMTSSSYATVCTTGGSTGGRGATLVTMVDNGGTSVAPTSTTFRVNTFAGGNVNDEFVSVAVFGS